jgi:glucose/arabinose dehydrogenase
VTWVIPRSSTAVFAALCAALLAVGAGACATGDDDRDGAVLVGDTVSTTGDGSPAPPTSARSPDTTEPLPEPPPAPKARLGTTIADAAGPVDVATHPVTGTMYVIERRGTVRAIEPDGLGPVLLDVSDNVEPNDEEGLLGFAFSPDGTHAVLNKASAGRTSIVEYALDGEGGFDAASRRLVYGFDQPYDNHNGGAVLFGPDGMLYIFAGDGGFVADPNRSALDLSVPLGKILRIDPATGNGDPYTVPADNPFVGDSDALPEIWSYGLRNPWRASFDPSTGDLWIGDVGDFAWEEINVAWADEGTGRGTSFGWSAFEGTSRYNEDQPADGHEPPFFEYAHGEEGCSISAGARYRGEAIEDLVGWYVFADFCSGMVRALEVLDDRTPGRLVELGTVEYPVAVTAGPGGELFVVSVKGDIVPIVAR